MIKPNSQTLPKNCFWSTDWLISHRQYDCGQLQDFTIEPQQQKSSHGYVTFLRVFAQDKLS